MASTTEKAVATVRYSEFKGKLIHLLPIKHQIYLSFFTSGHYWSLHLVFLKLAYPLLTSEVFLSPGVNPIRP